MASGIWTAVSGAIAQGRQIESVANNMANADTVGFKKDEPTFQEYISLYERDKVTQDIPHGPVTDKDFYPLEGEDQSHVIVDGTHVDFRQGSLKVTNSALDVALDGPGFLEVSTPAGVRYTRQGSLKISKDGKLVSLAGHPVLSRNAGESTNALVGSTNAAVQPGQGRPSTQGGVEVGQLQQQLEARSISVADRKGPLTITQSGEVFVGQNKIADLSLVEFVKPNLMEREGGLLYSNELPENIRTDQSRTKVRQRMLETSNVNPIEEMVKMIQAQKGYEMNMKAIQTHDQLMDKANEVGKF